MIIFVLFLSICISQFAKCTTVSTDDIMSHKNWEFLPAAKECGQNRHRSRILGGHRAPLGRFPWLGRLGYTNLYNPNKFDYRCGGTLINDRYILTAAHCVQENLKIVRIGENLPDYVSTDCTNGKCNPYIKDVSMEDIIIHPEYNSSSYKADIALIRLRDRVQYNAFIQPVCLPRDKMLEKTFFGEKFTVIGWGQHQAFERDSSRYLRYVEVPMRDLCACASIYPTLMLDDSQMCVGQDDGKDSCGGDSGGPLTWVNRMGSSKIHYQIGLVSMGKPNCGEAPAIYSSIIYYIPWILDNIFDTNNVIDEDEA